MSGSIAIVGKKSSVLPFLSSGATVYFIEDGEAQKKIEELINQGAKIIFFAEEFINELKNLLEKYQVETFPCLVPFYSGKKTGIGINRVREIIKRACGVDIFIQEV